MDVNCERYSAKIDAATCIARQQAGGSLAAGCKGCEKGAEIMTEHKENEFTEERYPSGALKITGKCMDCGKRKIVISKKNPICKVCYDIRKGKRAPGEHRRQGGSRGAYKKYTRKAAARATLGDYVFSVDLSNFKALSEALKRKADAELRTVGAQIAWELKERFKQQEG